MASDAESDLRPTYLKEPRFSPARRAKALLLCVFLHSTLVAGLGLLFFFGRHGSDSIEEAYLLFDLVLIIEVVVSTAMAFATVTLTRSVGMWLVLGLCMQAPFLGWSFIQYQESRLIGWLIVGMSSALVVLSVRSWMRSRT